MKRFIWETGREEGKIGEWGKRVRMKTKEKEEKIKDE